VLVGLLGLLGCKSTSDKSAIPQVLQGKPDTTDPAVVALRMGGNYYCTGTIVGPKLVLTAAHCFDNGGAVAISTRLSDIYSGADWRPATNVHIETGWIPGQPQFNSDIAIVELAEAINIPPIPINFDRDAADHLTEVRMVGYGPTGTNFGDQGIKRYAAVPIHPTAGFLETQPGKGTCYGDSGGPSFATINGEERVVAVTSHGLATQCERGGRVVRTDVHRTFLARYLNVAPTPPGPSGSASAPPTPSLAPTASLLPPPPPPPQPIVPLNPYQPPIVPPLDPFKTIDCSGTQVITLSGTSVTVTTGPAIRASGNCTVTLTGVDVRGPIGIEASGDARVVMTGGTLNADTAAVTTSGSASVQLVGTHLTGASKATGNATLVGTN
jgi:hypothetical protein